MKIEFEYYGMCLIKEKGKRKSEQALIRKTAFFEVAECESGELIFGAKVTPQDLDPIEIYVKGGEIYKKASVFDQQLNAMYVAGYNFNRMRVVSDRDEDIVSGSAALEIVNTEQERETIAKKFEEILYCDGTYYTQVEMPVVKISSAYSLQKPLFICQVQEIVPDTDAITFPITEMPKLEEIFKNVICRDRKSIYHQMGSVEISEAAFHRSVEDVYKCYLTQFCKSALDVRNIEEKRPEFIRSYSEIKFLQRSLVENERFDGYSNALQECANYVNEYILHYGMRSYEGSKLEMMNALMEERLHNMVIDIRMAP